MDQQWNPAAPQPEQQPGESNQYPQSQQPPQHYGQQPPYPPQYTPPPAGPYAPPQYAPPAGQYSPPPPPYGAPSQPLPPAYAQPGQPQGPLPTFDHSRVTTAFELPGVTVERNYGIVRGIIVRSRSSVGNIGASFQSIVGGNISLYTELCEQARRDAYELMIQHAAALGANAVIGVRYDATEIASGITEFLCYGTAVTVAPRPA